MENDKVEIASVKKLLGEIMNEMNMLSDLVFCMKRTDPFKYSQIMRRAVEVDSLIRSFEKLQLSNDRDYAEYTKQYFNW